MVPLNQWIKIKSPATVANMVCGFDILGFAVNDPYDEMEMRLVPRAENTSAQRQSLLLILTVIIYPPIQKKMLQVQH